MSKVVLLRHGQSTWNKKNIFTGWTDVDLSERGIEEAKKAGIALREAGLELDVALTSYLKRAIRTLWLVLEEMDRMWLPVDTDWRLNERHYGALQGFNKKEMVEKHGKDQVRQWRRGYEVRPPALDPGDPTHPSHDLRYRDLEQVPSSESLADTLIRVVPYWREKVIPLLEQGKQPVISAHGNSLRALIKHLDGISDEKIMELNVPTGIPLIYEFNQHFEAVNNYYLADEDALNSAVKEVANQTTVAKQ